MVMNEGVRIFMYLRDHTGSDQNVNQFWHGRSAQYARTNVRNMLTKHFYNKVALT